MAKIKAGDEVLWALAKTEAPDYKYPSELVLSAPASAKAGSSFTVRVWSYDEKGKRTPQAGAKVTGASAPTGADGRTTVTLAKPAKLIAKATGEIPSARVAVCIGGKCPEDDRTPRHGGRERAALRGARDRRLRPRPRRRRRRRAS